MRVKLIRGLILILIILFVEFAFSPSSKINAAQCATGTQIMVENGLISAQSLSAFGAGANVSCIESSRAVIPQFAIQTYSEMKTLYYDQADSSISKIKLTGTKTQDNPPNDVIRLVASENDKLYWITNNPAEPSNPDLIINADTPVLKNGVVFIDGDLYINSDLKKDKDTTGLVFVVQGKIYISPGVKTINAFMISYTGFCSAWNGTTCADDNPANQNYLTINGSVISLSSIVSPQFVREKATPDIAAETINYQSKYLVILKDIFSRDLKIWKEVQ